MDHNFLIHTEAEQGSQEWLEARKDGIASTDSAAALGVSKWKTPLELFQEKIGEIDSSIDPWLAERGHALEPAIRRHYANETGRSVTHLAGTIKHHQHSFMLASLDGYTDDGRLTEFKTSGTKVGWGEEGTDEVPPEYLIQVQHAMLVAGFPVADICVSFFAAKPVMYIVEADPELQQMILDGASDFWNKVQNRIEPEPVSIEEMQKKYHINDEIAAIMTPDVAEAYAELIESKEAMELAKGRHESCKEAIQKFLLKKGAATLADQAGKRLITWNESAGRVTLDSKKLKAQEPEIFAKYSKASAPTRRFLIK